MRRDSRAACASTHGNDGWDCVAQWDDHRTRCDPSCLGRRIAEANVLVLDDIPSGVLQHKKVQLYHVVLISEGTVLQEMAKQIA